MFARNYAQGMFARKSAHIETLVCAHKYAQGNVCAHIRVNFYAYGLKSLTRKQVDEYAQDTFILRVSLRVSTSEGG